MTQKPAAPVLNDYWNIEPHAPDAPDISGDSAAQLRVRLRDARDAEMRRTNAVLLPVLAPSLAVIAAGVTVIGLYFALIMKETPSVSVSVQVAYFVIAVLLITAGGVVLGNGGYRQTRAQRAARWVRYLEDTLQERERENSVKSHAHTDQCTRVWALMTVNRGDASDPK